MSGFPIVVVRIHPGSSDAMLRRPLWWVARSPSAARRWMMDDSNAGMCRLLLNKMYVTGRVVNGEAQIIIIRLVWIVHDCVAVI